MLLNHTCVLTYHTWCCYILWDSLQVHLMNLSTKGNGSLIKWVIYPAGSTNYMTNAAAMVIPSSNICMLLLNFNNFCGFNYLSYLFVGNNTPFVWKSCSSSWYIWELQIISMEYWAPTKKVYRQSPVLCMHFD